MRYLIVLRGLPASGKSSWIEQNDFGMYTLSSDKYRLSLSAPIYDVQGQLGINQTVSSIAWKNLRRDLEFRMQHGEFTIVDATNVTKEEVYKYRTLCKKYFYRLVVVEFTKSKAQCIIDDIKRTFPVGINVIQKMADKWEELPNSICKVSSDECMDYLFSKYEPLDFSSKKVHVIGDIHGCYVVLKKFIDDNVHLEKDIVIFTGDYFDRGIENYKVFEFLYNIKDKKNVYLCLGNHDRRIMQYLWGEDVTKTQFYNHTLKELRENGVTDKMLKSFVSSLLPCVYFIQDKQYYIISHAGVTHPIIDVSIPEDSFVRGVGNYEDMEQVCKTFKFFLSCRQIFGHRNNKDCPIQIEHNSFNLCGFPEYGGQLKAVTIVDNGLKEHYVDNEIFSKNGYYMAINKYPERFTIYTVSDLVEVFRHNTYVKEVQYGDVSSFNFTKEAFYTDNWGKIQNKARGLFINTKLNKIVARSYDKFFLLGQYDYCTLDKFKPPFTVYKKYDGFLGILGYNPADGNFVWCSKSTIAPYGEYANLFKSKLEPLIKDTEKLRYWLKENDVSLVFECIAPKEDEHIIKYDKDRVILLDIVKNKMQFQTKDLTFCSEYVNIGDNQIVLKSTSVADFLFDGVETKELIGQYDSLNIDYLKSQEGEGFVIIDADGKMFKLKTYEYELQKQLRTFKEYYNNIKQKAGNHPISCPPKIKVEQKYSHIYDTDRLYEGLQQIIDEVNKQ